ncbi:MAG: hypothetical protein ABII10_02230 [Candidatus Paceibacterota bacterium]
MIDKPYNQNQTQFVVEEPLLEQPISVIPPQEPITPVIKKPRFPKWVWPLIGGVAVLLIISLIIILRKSPMTAPVEEEGSAIDDQRVLSPLEQRLEIARQNLEKANPTTQDLPFPPLDLKLRIDDAR